jgi:enamine deaminase RidA (YjgF/YER057c/UK114 family)
VTVVDATKMVFLAGQCPLDEWGQLVDTGDLRMQVERVIHNIVTALSYVGATPDDVVRTVIYVVSPDCDNLFNYFFSSGDSGSACGNKNPLAQYPATSAYVTSVGGRTLAKISRENISKKQPAMVLVVGIVFSFLSHHGKQTLAFLI